MEHGLRKEVKKSLPHVTFVDEDEYNVDLEHEFISYTDPRRKEWN